MPPVDDLKSGAANPGPFVVSDPCPVCNGQGTISEQPCPTCRGTGVQRLSHGTRADLKSGDQIAPGYASNFGTRKKARFAYLTGTLDAATWGAELALGEGPGRISMVEPTSPIEDDPNLTDKKHPGNPPKSYRSREPLRVTGKLTEWQSHSPAVLKAMTDHREEMKRRGVEAIHD